MPTYYIVRDIGYGDLDPRAYTVAFFLETDPGELPSGDYGVDWVVVKAESGREAKAMWCRKELHLYEDVAVDLFAVEAVAS
jgi:hypothetical protein